MNLTQARAEVSRLASKAQVVADNDKLTVAQRHAELDKIQKQVIDAQAVVRGLEHVDRQSNALRLATEGPDGDVFGRSFGGPGLSDDRLVTGAAPSLAIAPDEAKALRDAAMSNQSIAVDTKTAGTITDALVGPSVLPTASWPAVGIAREPNRVLDIIPLQVAPAGSVVQWYVASGTSSAAAVAEGGLKPLSDLNYTANNGTLTKIAHRATITQEVLEDFLGFQQALAADMTAGLIDAESAEVLSGSGSTPHLQGLLGTSGVGALSRTGGEPGLNTIMKAITALRNASPFVETDAMVMAPSTYGSLLLTADANGRYLVGDVINGGSPTIWGVPVVVSSKMPDKKILLGRFAEATRGWVKGGIRILTNYDSDDFSHNRVSFVAEERLLVVAVRPSALTLVDIT